MTHIDNLREIISQNGILCNNLLLSKHHSAISIANEDVQDKRAKVVVPLSPGGTLHDYVPFYFWGTTPMLLVNRFQQNDIVFLVSYTTLVAEANIKFVFTDRHAVIKYAKFYNNLDSLNDLDWKSIKNKQWDKIPTHPDRKEKKQAEFLIYKQVPWQLIYGIGVANNNVIDKISNILTGSSHQPIIKVIENWYFV